MSFARKYLGESSFLRKYLHGWQFRSSTPSFEAGEEILVTLTDFDEERSQVYARIGDTRLYVDGEHDAADVGKRARVRVTDFDTSKHVGEGEVLEVVGELGL